MINHDLLISNLKIELGEDALKDLVLRNNLQEFISDNYEAYFYLDEQGNPMFVVEQKK